MARKIVVLVPIVLVLVPIVLVLVLGMVQAGQV